MRGAISPLPNTPSWHGVSLSRVYAVLFVTFLRPSIVNSIECDHRLQDGCVYSCLSPSLYLYMVN